LVDIVAPAVAPDSYRGWGNYVNQELYGAPTDLPWKIFIEPQNRLPEFRDQAYYHPLFLYESLWNFANFLFLLWLGRRYQERLKPGDIFLVYLITTRSVLV
jgi:phosphatidylglycerol:prolipoprotein diacylglycerol transferase